MQLNGYQRPSRSATLLGQRRDPVRCIDLTAISPSQTYELLLRQAQASEYHLKRSQLDLRRILANRCHQM